MRLPVSTTGVIERAAGDDQIGSRQYLDFGITIKHQLQFTNLTISLLHESPFDFHPPSPIIGLALLSLLTTTLCSTPRRYGIDVQLGVRLYGDRSGDFEGSPFRRIKSLLNTKGRDGNFQDLTSPDRRHP
jgi:hypothetical protein